MPLTLYYVEASPPVRTVDLVIHALGLKVDHKDIDVANQEHLLPEFLKLNPLHTIPTIVDEDGFVLWESRAIMTYLVSKYGKDDSLYPKDLKKRAIVDQRLHYSNEVFFSVRHLTQGLILFNQPVTEEHITKIKIAQENVEKLLEGHKFMAGDSLTVADYSFITLLDAMEVYSPVENKFPLTKAWFNRCKLTMKGYEQVNAPGAKQLIDKIKEKLASYGR